MTEVRAASVSRRVLIRLSDHQEIGVQDISRPGNQDALEMVRGFSPYGLFDNCRGSSTNRPRFLQNKANFRKGQTNVSFFITKDYENIRACGVQQSKAKQSQIPAFRPEARSTKCEIRNKPNGWTRTVLMCLPAELCGTKPISPGGSTEVRCQFTYCKKWISQGICHGSRKYT